MSAATCYALAAVSRSPSVSPGMRPRPWRQAAVLPFSTTPNSKCRRRPFLSCAAINISPDALVHPAREKKRQEGIAAAEGKKKCEITDGTDSVKLSFLITDIVQKSKVEDTVQVVLNHDVLMISEKKTATNADGRHGTLDVRLLVTAGYYKEPEPECLWHKDDGGEVHLEVTIKKRAEQSVRKNCFIH